MAWEQVVSLKGPKGDQGPQGPQGNQGPQGPTGEDGKGIEIAGSVETYASLPSGLTAADAGKGYLVNADGLLYIWSGTAFPPSGEGTEFRGPEGPQGTSGADGVSVTSAQVDANGDLTLTLSDATEQGPWNVKGPKGDQGNPGVQGTKGDKGDTGNTGSTGVGVSSASVDASGNLSLTLTNTAVQGPWNVKGPKGDTGAQGLQGATGDPGAQGETGLQGPQGLQGVQGPPGDQGPKGDTGNAGARGTKWFTGTGSPGSLTDERDGDLYLNLETGQVWKFSNGV